MDELEIVRSEIRTAYHERLELTAEINTKRFHLLLLKPFVSFVSPFRRHYERIQADITQLEQKKDRCICLLPEVDVNTVRKWDELNKAFTAVTKSKRVWSILYSRKTDSAYERTSAQIARSRREFVYEYKTIPFIKSDQNPIFLPTKQGSEFYIFPQYTVIIVDKHTIIVCNTNEVAIRSEQIEYIEEESLASDTAIIRQTWKKANLDGSIDKRYSGNFQIPIVAYVLVTISLGKLHSRTLWSESDAGVPLQAAIASYF